MRKKSTETKTKVQYNLLESVLKDLKILTFCGSEKTEYVKLLSLLDDVRE